MKSNSIVVALLSLVITLTSLGCGESSIEAEEHFSTGINLHGAGRLQSAIRQYDEAIRLDPQLAKAYNSRGVAYGLLGQYQRAIQDLDEAIRLEALLGVAYANRSAAYTVLEKNEEARQDVERAVEVGINRVQLETIIEGLKTKRNSGAKGGP